MALKKKTSKLNSKNPSKLNLWLRAYIDETNYTTFLNKTESAKAAGYNCSTNDSLRNIGCQCFTKLSKEIEKWQDEVGLSEVALKNKLLDLIEAKQTVFAQKDGKFTDEREIKDNPTRCKALDMAFKVRGSYSPTKHEVSGPDGGPLTLASVVKKISEENKKERGG